MIFISFFMKYTRCLDSYERECTILTPIPSFSCTINDMLINKYTLNPFSILCNIYSVSSVLFSIFPLPFFLGYTSSFFFLCPKPRLPLSVEFLDPVPSVFVHFCIPGLNDPLSSPPSKFSIIYYCRKEMGRLSEELHQR